MPDIVVTEEPARLASSFIHGMKRSVRGLDAAGLKPVSQTASSGQADQRRVMS